MIDTLISVSDGDLRRAITYLQSAARLSSAGDSKVAITSREIQETAGVVPTATVRAFAASLGIDSEDPTDEMDVDEDDTAKVRATFRKAQQQRGFDDIKSQVKLIMRKGYSVAQLLYQVNIFASLLTLLLTFGICIKLHDLVVQDSLITERQKSNIALILGQADKSLTDGGDEELQLLEVALKISQSMKDTS